MLKKLSILLAVAMTALLSATAAFAAYTFDPASGTGFVGKGDVQLVYGYNNQQLQTNAAKIDFRTSTTSETTWTCSKPNPSSPDKPDIVNNRSNETTTQGLATTVARDTSKGKNGPVTGFNLTGYDSPATTVTSGSAIGSCPANPSGFTYDVGSEQTTTGPTVLEVTNDGGLTWYIVPAPVAAA
jgi:hypothetical protein